MLPKCICKHNLNNTSQGSLILEPSKDYAAASSPARMTTMPLEPTVSWDVNSVVSFQTTPLPPTLSD
jgi:hypothetical protein